MGFGVTEYELCRIAVKPATHTLFHEVDGEIVALNLQNGSYYGLNEVGTAVWRLINEHGRMDHVLETMLANYEVTEEALTRDLRMFIDSLLSNGLIEIDEIPA